MDPLVPVLKVAVLQTLIKSLLKCESDLRELLSRSIGDLIIEYPKVKQATAAVDQTQAKLNVVLIEEKMHAVASDTLEPFAREFIVQFWEHLQIPLMKNASKCIIPNVANSQLGLIERLENHFALLNVSHNHFINYYSEQMFLSILAHGREIRVYQLIFERGFLNEIFFATRSLGKFVADEEVKKLLVFPQVQKPNQHILILADHHVLKFDPSVWKMFSYTKFDPPINHIPLMIVSLVQNVEYLYWDSDNKQIRQTNDKVVAINCSSLPFLKTTYSSKYVFFS